VLNKNTTVTGKSYIYKLTKSSVY